MLLGCPGNLGKDPIDLLGVLQGLIGKKDIKEGLPKRKALRFDVHWKNLNALFLCGEHVGG
jgi:hypothetical protein